MTDREELRKALADFEGKIYYDEPMALHTSMKVGGKADALVLIENEDQLAGIVRNLGGTKINYLPVGNMTNVIVRDGGYRGVILLMNGLKEIDYQQEPDGGYFLAAGAGASLSHVVSRAVDCGLTGMEFCAGIPGSVGGAVWMNAGAFGREIKDVVTEVSLLEAGGGKEIRKKEEITFQYRKTVLPENVLILSARFKLDKGSEDKIRQKIMEIMAKRRERHPLNYPNAGSIFKNLPGLPAGRLIEELGLKGKTCGDAQISMQHANFIVNKGRATAADVLKLIDLVGDTARKERGVQLETEVIIVGEDQCRRN
jgi:UDP-N-acetylmuramate dehydrogenase